MADSLRVGVAGLGTVGAGVLKMFTEHRARLDVGLDRPLRVTGVCARNRSADRGVDLSTYRWFDDPVALATSDEIDVFVELIGGEEGPARASVEAALKAGKPVVTANKALLAHHGTALARLAEDRGVALKFEAAVAGGIPIIKALRESLRASSVRRVYGILNGTCNYILSAMTNEGRDFADVLSEAQAKGYAEADPTFDVGGFDAAHKLALLTSIAFGTEVAFDDIHVEGIENITAADIELADEFGYRIKLVGVALQTDDGIEQRVHPTLVPKDSAMAGVGGVTNCVAVEGDYVGSVMLVGPGAGEGPTASSVVSDLLDVAGGEATPAFVTAASALKPAARARMRAHTGSYYIRLSVLDRAGAFASLATRMAEQGVSLRSIVQRQPEGGTNDESVAPSSTPVVLVTHETTESAIRKALEAIDADGHVNQRPQLIRIERF